MKVAYYPGCTLKTRAENLEAPGLAAMEALGIEPVEVERWNCCGVVFSLADDDLLRLVAPVRNLIRVREAGFETVITLCPMCYNTLARANLVMGEDEEKRGTINTFMEEEPDYAGEVEVTHLLGFLRDEIGWDRVKEAVKAPLSGMKVAPYYGCTLVRPKEVALDSAENPRFLHDLLEALGATPVGFPEATRCCGTYLTIGHPEATANTASRVLASAQARGAEAVVSSCPLCEYNLGRLQSRVREADKTVREIPTVYFTQLLASALGLEEGVCRFDLNEPAARTFLTSRKNRASA
ncbi:MAG: CoB--CoM heterodisulfide reductase iron-sulfur subunit B family protein [Planctomycetota bacterium]|jgi:heterodisulfide reductase subunit B